MAGVGRVGFELAAQLGDVEAQVAGLGAVVGSPDLGEQLLGLHQRTSAPGWRRSAVRIFHSVGVRCTAGSPPDSAAG